MPITRRYSPEKPPDEICTFGMDYSFILPRGVGITKGDLDVFTNTVPPQEASDHFVLFGDISVRDRTVYATLGGGHRGTDYQFRWYALDTEGNVWPRTALCLCADTS